MLAQGMAEYGGASALAAMIQRASMAVEDAVHGLDIKVVAVVVIVALFLFFRRR